MHGDDLLWSIKGETEPVRSLKESASSIEEILRANNVPVGSSASAVSIVVKGPSGFGSIFGLLLNFLPLIIFGAILIFMMRQAGGANNQAMSFGTSRARMTTGTQQTSTFLDVAGQDGAREELQAVVRFLH